MQTPLRSRSSWVLAAAIVVMTQGAGGGNSQAQPAANRSLPDEGARAIWPSGPLDVVAAFERPVDPQRAKGLVGQSIAYFTLAESGNGTGQQERRAGALRIVAVRVGDSGRTLFIATDPHPLVARYVLPLAALQANAGVRQARDSGAAYDLSGVEWGWSPAAAEPGDDPRVQGWWPALDLEATRRLTKGSRPHEVGLALLRNQAG